MPSTLPILDPHSNPWIKRLKIYKETPHILKARKQQAAPRQVQHRLQRSPRNVGTNFLTQASHHLVANHLFKLLHAYHIYNKKGGKENIYTLLMGGERNTW